MLRINALKIGCAASLLLISSLVLAHTDSTQIGRYTSVVDRPTRAQINPLLAVSQFRFGLHVQTVGQAVAQVLQNTGYALAPRTQLPADIISILQKPLPITQRKLGPLSIKTTLTVLMGQQVVELIADPIHRLVTFRINPRIQRALTHGVPSHVRHR